MSSRFHAVLAVVALAATAPCLKLEIGKPDLIQAGRLRAHLEFIASDELGGRDTPSLGLDIACLYVAAQLSLAGVEPGGENGTYFQTVPLGGESVLAEGSRASFGGRALAYGTDFFGQLPAGGASGGLVYAGRGMVNASQGIDPYAGMDVNGRIVVCHQAGRAAQGWTPAAQAAAERGAVGIVYIPNQATTAAWARSVERAGQGRPSYGAARPGLPSIVASEALVRAMFEGEAHGPDALLALSGSAPAPESFALGEAKRLEFSVATDGKAASARNVVGIVRGSDPVLKDEYVAFGAHIDHIGTTTRDVPDKIYNGADDDGSGVVALIEMAAAMANGPRPKRSLLFVWHIGEEKGLWGSEHFTSNPTVPIGNIVAQLNIDMIGRSKAPGDTNPRNAGLTAKDGIYVVGSTKMSTDLQKLSEAVNDSYLKLKFDYKYDDPNDREQIFYRSDHIHYARKGVPVIFYFSGIHEDYHQPSDEVDKIDFEKLEAVARTIYATGWAVADAAKRPVVDKPLPGGR